MPQDEDTEDVEVTWEDQQNINTFSKLNTRLRTIEEKLQAIKVTDFHYPR
jgi:prefoldin subunit 4